MRPLADAARIRAFMRALGGDSRAAARVYFTGGATAVLLGWRSSTVDVDLRVEGAEEPVLRALPGLKERLQINVELASPPDFIPEVPGWRERSLFISREGALDFLHFDPYSQALAKIERGHALDREDVRQMLERGLVLPARAWEFFRDIEPQLYRYPAIAPESFRRAAAEALGSPP